MKKFGTVFFILFSVRSAYACSPLSNKDIAYSIPEKAKTIIVFKPIANFNGEVWNAVGNYPVQSVQTIHPWEKLNLKVSSRPEVEVPTDLSVSTA